MRAEFMGQDDLSHRDLLREIAAIGGKVDLVHGLLAERKEDIATLRSDVSSLFTQQRQLESRLAWLAGVGAVIALAVPLLVTWFAPDEVLIREPAPRQQGR